ncbi:hypothetical protein Pelo_7300 [Pelomyxa schiedti]|nr:hypothetical protein Pelo_7300 [Pelomyxa schiedti]
MRAVERLLVVVGVVIGSGVIVGGDVVGMVVIPHGGIAIDPTQFDGNETQMELAWEINSACTDVGQMILSMKPDVIVLDTPHGVANDNNFAFYLNSHGYGSAATEGGYAEYCMSVPLDSTTAQQLLDSLYSLKLNVSGMTAFGSDSSFPLHAGEIIPLWFERVEVIDASAGLPTTPCGVVVISQPTRRLTDPVGMIPELLTLGNSLYDSLRASPLRVVVIISGDLAHTHDATGPYGYSPTAEPFDEACGQWVEKQDRDQLLDVAAGLVEEALCCGFTGFCILQGMLDKSLSLGEQWDSHLFANGAPSYYGMMVGSFVKV